MNNFIDLIIRVQHIMYFLLELKKVHIKVSGKIGRTGLIFFMCRSVLTTSVSSTYFISLLAIVSILYLSISDYLLVWIEFL